MSTNQFQNILGVPAPNFTLTAHDGRTVTLSDYQGRQNVILFFVRTYNCYSCRQHVEHLVRLYPDFQSYQTEVLVVLHSDKVATQGYADITRAPFPVLADPDHTTYDLYGLNQVFLLSTRTGSVVVDQAGKISYMKSQTNPWGWRNETESLVAHLRQLAEPS